MLTVKVPSAKVTDSVARINPVAVLPEDKLGQQPEGIVVGLMAKDDPKLRLKRGKRHHLQPEAGWNNAYTVGSSPHRNRGRHFMGGRIDHRNRVGEKIRHKHTLSIRCNGNPFGPARSRHCDG